MLAKPVTGARRQSFGWLRTRLGGCSVVREAESRVTASTRVAHCKANSASHCTVPSRRLCFCSVSVFVASIKSNLHALLTFHPLFFATGGKRNRLDSTTGKRVKWPSAIPRSLCSAQIRSLKDSISRTFLDSSFQRARNHRCGVFYKTEPEPCTLESACGCLPTQIARRLSVLLQNWRNSRRLLLLTMDTQVRKDLKIVKALQLGGA